MAVPKQAHILISDLKLKTCYLPTTLSSGPLDEISLFVPSDLRDFQPSPTTYVFFGKRGSGKTTIRLMMQRAYEEANAAYRAEGTSRGHFIVDLARPTHLTHRLRAFQDAIGATDENWDAIFAETWTTSDLVDCILSFIATTLTLEMADPRSVEGADMAARAGGDPRAARQMLLLAHLYADVDAKTLKSLRAWLIPPRYRYSSMALAGGAAVATVALTGTLAVGFPRDSAVSRALGDTGERILDEVDTVAPFVTAHPRLTIAALAAVSGASAWALARSRRLRSLERAAVVQSSVRVVKKRPMGEIAALLDATFSPGDSADTVRTLTLGISAFQKLDHISSLLYLLGFESLTVFGDCFDEVSLLDPVTYPSAMKAFALQACRNDFLNFGRLHMFFPETRLALDLNTDRVLKEARFDRHFVRDLTWSRHQLAELAERRFLAAQLEAQRRTAAVLGGTCGATSPRGAAAEAAVAALVNGGRTFTFADLFAEVKKEDLSSYLSRLSTPRELMIMMSELFARMESNSEGGLSSQDLEIATQKALEQAV